MQSWDSAMKYEHAGYKTLYPVLHTKCPLLTLHIDYRVLAPIVHIIAQSHYCIAFFLQSGS